MLYRTNTQIRNVNNELYKHKKFRTCKYVYFNNMFISIPPNAEKLYLFYIHILFINIYSIFKIYGSMLKASLTIFYSV